MGKNSGDAGVTLDGCGWEDAERVHIREFRKLPFRAKALIVEEMGDLATSFAVRAASRRHRNVPRTTPPRT